MPTFTQFLLLSVLTATSSVFASPSRLPSSDLLRRDPPGWTSQGCYTDAPGARTLKARSIVREDSMTVQTCTSYCFGQGFNVAGVEFGVECFCDWAIQSPGAPTDDSECNMPCSGNEEEFCGAGNRINIYKTDATGPSTPAVVSGWDYQGCFTLMAVNAGVSIEKCIAACNNNGFTYAGMEYSNECYCGTSLTTALKKSDGECSMTCQANRNQFCGAPDRLTVYKAPGAPAPVIPPCEGKPFTVCCAAVTEWSANIPRLEGTCHYTAPSLSEVVGDRCVPRPSTGCPAGYLGTCCVGSLGGACGLGTNCALPF
ncbi:hypothetical protein ONZ45_g7847 [Pleurotus djamor]|nr:hypothetical protein ONZ45_g7847 [Pleurotus djamor]